MDTNRTNPARPRPFGDEHGMALVIALLVLMVMTVIGAALMTNVNIETKMTGHKARDTQALAVAEAGVQEAILRIRNGDILDDGNPRAVSLIYNQVAGSIPVSGTDTTSLATLQPTGTWLNYSTPNKNTSVLSVKYKTRGSQILKYDENAATKVNTATGNRIYVITSTGRSGTATRQIQAEVTRATINVLARAAVAANVGIDFGGNINVCGHDHRMDTPVGAIPGGGGGAPDCNSGAYFAPTAHGTCLPGAWSGNNVTKGGSADVIGEPSNWQSMQTGFYSGPWDVLAMTQPEFWSWVGAPYSSAPMDPHGVIYVDDNNVKQDAHGDFTYNSGDGEGLLYVDGDLQINGNFYFTGLLYIEGDLDINGDAWILGGLICKGTSSVKIANGSATILYSSEAIAQKIAKYGGDLRTIAWRELTP
jgi:Tfp pilus assembly protein PilX